MPGFYLARICHANVICAKKPAANASVLTQGTAKVYAARCTTRAQKYTAAAVAVAPLLTPSACAARTSAAKTARFSIAFACAFIMRTAHGDCGFGAAG